MHTCCSGFCGSLRSHFDAVVAEGDLKRYKTKGPNPTTRKLRDGVLLAGVGQSLLDIGAGIGAVSFELLNAGFATAVAVDAAPGYVAVARREAEARGFRQRMTVIEGDFVTIAETVAPADAVILDRVVCCYPEVRPLLEQALRHSRQSFGYSYPRDRWYVRLVVALDNLRRALARNPFRTAVHSVATMEAEIGAHGFLRSHRSLSLVWAVDVYVRGAT
jgi:magnesium-protoporphyrin O-methyltransferase